MRRSLLVERFVAWRAQRTAAGARQVRRRDARREAPLSAATGSGEAPARPRDGVAEAFAHVRYWVFDLDNTLYPADCHLFHQIDARMTAFIERALKLGPVDARRVQKDYYARYGTTMSGLMREHGVDPHDFMAFVHDIDLSVVDENPALAAVIADLPGEKYVFTNGSERHADNVTAKLGLSGLFAGVFDIASAAFTPKPHRATYERFLSRHAVAPGEAAMFEDIAVNLAEPHALGMTTVLVASSAAWLDDEPSAKRPAKPDDRHGHVHHVTDDLTGFLERVAPRAPARPAPPHANDARPTKTEEDRRSSAATDGDRHDRP
ncbi:MAG: pyrimidine 5'-nucleotidase [Pseudomonadota bacterium]